MCCRRTSQLPTPPCPHRHPRRLTSIGHPLITFRVYRGGRSSRYRQWVRITAVRAFRRRCLWDYTSCAIGLPATRSHSCLQLRGAQTRSSRIATANTLATVRVCARPVSPVTTHPEPFSVSPPSELPKPVSRTPSNALQPQLSEDLATMGTQPSFKLF
jgi:hypothetical protein